MPLPTNKPVLLNDLLVAYQKLDAEFDNVPVALERSPDIEGDISCCDVLAYQLGWGRLLLSWEAAELKGEVPAMPADGYRWNQLGALAQSFYQRDADKSLAVLRAEFKQLIDQLKVWIEALEDDALFQPHHRQWTGDKWAMVKWIQVNTIAPYRSARTKVRRWKKTLV